MRSRKNIGELGEFIAKRYLIKNGYDIVANNWRYGRVELDLIAKKENTLCCVEVKTRRKYSMLFPREAVNHRKRLLLTYGMHKFCDTYPDNCDIRFDIIEVYLYKNPQRINHIKDAYFYFFQ